MNKSKAHKRDNPDWNARILSVISDSLTREEIIEHEEWMQSLSGRDIGSRRDHSPVFLRKAKLMFPEMFKADPEAIEMIENFRVLLDSIRVRCDGSPMTDSELAILFGTNRSTIWRWSNSHQAPIEAWEIARELSSSSFRLVDGSEKVRVFEIIKPQQK